MNEATEKELRDEIARLRQLVTLLETRKGRRSARAECTLDPEAENPMKLQMLITVPGVMDEVEFGKYVGSCMAIAFNELIGAHAVQSRGAYAVPSGETPLNIT